MKLPESWTKVTLFSKILSIILFVSLPFIGFYFGIKYQKLKFTADIPQPRPTLIPISPTPTQVPVQNITNQKMKISFSAPANWQITNDTDLITLCSPDYPRCFTIKSSDLTQDEFEQSINLSPQDIPHSLVIGKNKDINVIAYWHEGKTEAQGYYLIQTPGQNIIINHNYNDFGYTARTLLDTFEFKDSKPPTSALDPNDYRYTFKANLTYKLPLGWDAKKQMVDLTDTYNFEYPKEVEVLIISKADYSITIGGYQTGVASCTNDGFFEFIPLNNPYIADQVSRQIVTNNLKPLQDGLYHLSVCSNYPDTNQISTTTKYGPITYMVPVDFDNSILSQMDQIIESIKPN